MIINKLTIWFICLVFALCLYSLATLRGENSIVGDGFQNIQISSHLLQYHRFSSKEDGMSDMAREPTWPFLTAIVLKSLNMQSIPADTLATKHANIFKNINVIIYTIIILIIFLFLLFELNSYLFASFAMATALMVFITIPRFIFYYNNEALFSLLLLLSSILFLQTFRNRKNRLAIFLGLCLGLLSLTKAQY